MLNKRILIVFSLLIMCFSAAFSQEGIEVRGTLFDNDSRPISFANVMLLNPKDSSLLVGSVTDEKGFFALPVKEPGDAILKASFVGYVELSQRIQLLPGDNDLGRLIMRTENISLNEVTVVAQRPLISMKDGNIVTNIENSSLSMLGTAKDVMQYIPGVMKIGDALQISGKGSPDIYVDGRKLLDISELERIGSDNIKSVELILNPSAHYDAQSRAVLEIVTNRKKRDGLYVYMLGRLEARHYLLNREMLNIGYTQGKFDWFFNYSHSYHKEKYKEEEVQVKNLPDTIALQRDLSPNVESVERHIITGSFNYAINPNHTVGAKYTYITSKNDWRSNGGSLEMRINDVPLPVLWVNNHSKTNTNEHQANLFYQAAFSDNWGLQLDVDYLGRDFSSDSYVLETEDEITNRTDLSRNRSNRLVAARLDLNYDLKQAGKINGGGEYSYVETSGGSHLINSFNNLFFNKESKFAAFLSYNFQWNKLNFRAGLRYENVKAYASSNAEVLADKHYSSFYPSFSFFQQSREMSWGLNFSKRVKRPSFAQLSNDMTYYNRYYSYYGNPSIDPEDIYDLELSARYKSLSFRMNYQYVSNYIVHDFFIDPLNTLATIEQPTNYPDYHVLGLALTAERNIAFWKIVFNGSVYKPFFKVPNKDTDYTYNKPYVDLSVNNSLMLPKDYVFRLDGYFYSGGSRGNLNYKAQGSIDVSINKGFINNTLMLSLRASDLFRWMDTHTYGEMNGLTKDRYMKRDSRSVMLTLTWKFNSSKSSYKGVGAAKEEMNR